MYTRIVVPLDGSENAETALADAEQLAALSGAPIHLVRVIDLASAELGAIYATLIDTSVAATLVADETEAALAYLSSVSARLDEAGHLVTYDVLRGAVPERLLSVARPGDLYIMASHGRSGVARWFMGSVAEEVVRSAPVPVLLVKRQRPIRESQERIPLPRVAHGTGSVLPTLT